MSVRRLWSSVSRICGVAYAYHPFKEGLELMERDHVGSVGQRLVRIRMHFHKETIDASAGRR